MARGAWIYAGEAAAGAEGRGRPAVDGGRPAGAVRARCGGHSSRPPAARMTYLGRPPASEQDSSTTRCNTRGSKRPAPPPALLLLLLPGGASSTPISRTPRANSARQKWRPSAMRESSTAVPHGGT